MKRMHTLTIRMLLPVLSVVVLVALAACQPAANETSAVDVPSEAQAATDAYSREANIKAINAVVGTFVEAYLTEDVDLFLTLFTDDAIRMPPDAPAFQGLGKIRVDIEQTFEAADIEITVNIEETEISGDMALVRGDWAVVQHPADGSEAVEQVGKWFNLMERQPDGSWKIHRNIWNRNHPLAS